jgi:integrase
METNKLTVYPLHSAVRRPRSELARTGAAIEYLVEPEYVALLEVAKVVPEHKLLIMVLWQTGLRVSEALALVRNDIYPDGINVLHGKGDKQRFVPCQQTILGELVRYQESHGQPRIFQKITTEPGVRYMLIRYAKLAGRSEEHTSELQSLS